MVAMELCTIVERALAAIFDTGQLCSEAMWYFSATAHEAMVTRRRHGAWIKLRQRELREHMHDSGVLLLTK